MITTRILTCDRSASRKRNRLPERSSFYLPATVDSVLKSDITSATVFAIRTQDDGVDYRNYLRVLDSLEGRMALEQKEWPGIYECYYWTLSEQFTTDWVLVLEDDVEVCPDIMERIRIMISDRPDMKVATLFDRDDIKHPWLHPWIAKGSQAMLYHKSIIPRLPKTYEEFQSGPCNDPALDYPFHDLIVNRHCNEPIHRARPSLVQHRGEIGCAFDRSEPLISHTYDNNQ